MGILKLKIFILIFIVGAIGFSSLGFLVGRNVGIQKSAISLEEVQPQKEKIISAVQQKTVSGASTSSTPQNKVKVIKVIDGDTIQIEGGKVVRYIGIDTPEMSNTQQLECFANEATLKNKEFVEGKEILLEKDISETDRYGRLLRYAYVDDQASPEFSIFVNHYLVRNGFAHASSYPPDARYQKQLEEAEKLAQEEKLGFWGSCGKVLGSNSDKDCSDFATQNEAQEFFLSQGGPEEDPHKLDQDHDGKVCESLP